MCCQIKSLKVGKSFFIFLTFMKVGEKKIDEDSNFFIVFFQLVCFQMSFDTGES